MTSMLSGWLNAELGFCVTAPYSRHRADSRLAPSQWETSLQSNRVSHWLGANPESARDTSRSCKGRMMRHNRMLKWGRNEAKLWPWWVAQGCHGRRLEAQWSPHSLLSTCHFHVSQRRHNVSTREAEASPRLRVRFTTEHIHYVATIGLPFCANTATTAMHVLPFGLMWATMPGPMRPEI